MTTPSDCTVYQLATPFGAENPKLFLQETRALLVNDLLPLPGWDWKEQVLTLSACFSPSPIAESVHSVEWERIDGLLVRVSRLVLRPFTLEHWYARERPPANIYLESQELGDIPHSTKWALCQTV